MTDGRVVRHSWSVNMLLKQFIVVLVSCSLPVIIYFVSTIIVQVQLVNKELKDLDIAHDE